MPSLGLIGNKLMVMYPTWSVMATEVVQQCFSIVRVKVFEYFDHIATSSSIYDCRQIKFLQSFWVFKIGQAIDNFGCPNLYVFQNVNVLF